MAKKEDTGFALQQLKADLRTKSIDRLYFFHGEEVFLLHHYLQQLKKMLVDELTESFNYHRLNIENFTVQLFADAVENLPMMAESTMVWVEEVDLFKLPETDRTKIAEVLCDIPEYCTVIFTYETTPWAPDKRMKKLWDSVQSNGQIVEFIKQSQKDLIAWVTRHFAAQGKKIKTDLCAYLIDITGGTMTALRSEIVKICAYSGSDEIKKSDIDAVTEPVLDAAVFQMTNLLSQGSYGAALQKLQQLLKMQQEPIAILGAVSVQFRQISTARVLLDQGKGAFELMKLTGMREYPAQKAMDAARHYRPEFCAKAAELIVDTDYKMKTSFDEKERLLEILILQLAREARHG